MVDELIYQLNQDYSAKKFTQTISVKEGVFSHHC